MCATCRLMNRLNQDRWREANPELSKQKSIDSAKKWARENKEEHARGQKMWIARLTPAQTKRRKAKNAAKFNERMAAMTKKEKEAFLALKRKQAKARRAKK